VPNNIQNKNKRIQQGKFKLNTLLQVTKSINNNLPKQELTAIYKDVLINQLNIGKILLYSFDGEKWYQELSEGAAYDFINVEQDLLPIQEITFINSSSNERLKDFDVVVPVFHKQSPIAYLLLADFDGESIEVSPIIKHLAFIQTLTNVIVVAIENKRLYKENIQQVTIKKEMELASEMQALLFPNNLPNNKHIEVAANYISNQLVGGDYYDFIPLNKEEVVFCIADVSGKGVSAALLMSNFQATLRVLVKRTSSLITLVNELNSSILATAKTEKFITAFIGRYNCKTKELVYVNAGHNPPILLSDNKTKLLKDGSTILGMFEELPIVKKGRILIDESSILLCYTDGITEQTNNKNTEFGINKLTKILIQHKDNKISTLLEQILDNLKNFKGEIPYTDDVTLLGIKFK